MIGMVSMFVVSCEIPDANVDEPNTPDQPNEEQHAAPEIKLGVDGVINMPAVGGNYELSYEVINPVEGVTLEVKADVAWIANIAVAENITFDVAKNYGEQRIGIVTVTYGDCEVAVAIQQMEALEQGSVRLSITSERKISFESYGGKGEITYLLECDVEDAIPAAETDVDWIVIDSVDEEKVYYTVESSNIEERRTGHIFLSYEFEQVSVTIDQKAAVLEPILVASSTNVYTNESVQFTVIYAGEDVTAESVVKEYYTSEVIGTTFVPTVVGDHSFYAEYNNRRSKVVTIHALPDYAPAYPKDTNPDSYEFNQRMLIVSHTGLGCGYCPPVKQVIHDAQQNEAYKDRFNVVYAYTFSSQEVCYSAAAKTLWNYYKKICSTGDQLTGYPSFTTNYCYNYTGKFNLEERIDELWDENPAASIAYAVKFMENQVVVSASVKSSVSQDYKLSLWLLEDDIHANQSNATADWMNIHNSVVRDMPTGGSSSDISGVDFGYVEAGTTVSRIFVYDLNTAASWNKDNFKLIAVLSAPSAKYKGNYEVVTTAICEGDGSVGFDYK